MMVRHLLIVSFVLGSAVAAQERTADPVKRGFKESDFPRSIQLADNVYAYEDLRSAGDERFTNEKVLFMSEAFLNRVFPAMRSAYPSEWVATVKKALTMDVQTYVPGHGFVEQPRVSREELQNAGKALEFVIGAVRTLHGSGTPIDDAVKKVDWGPYRDWRLSASQGPIAVRKIYEELDGKLK